MKKKLLYIMLFGMCLASLSGCGGSSEDETTESTQAKPSVTTEAHQMTEATTEEEEELDKDSEGFVKADDYAVLKEAANIYTEADLSSPIFMIGEEGDIYSRIGYLGDWTKISYDDTSFYIESSLVEVAEKEAPKPATQGDAETEDETKKVNERSLPKKIVIDPANQSVLNVEVEEVAPGSGERKAAASMGGTGVSTGVKEYELNLTYAQLLKTELEARGYKVTMTRETSDIDLGNMARAEMVNTSEASAVIRIQMNESSNPRLAGAMAMCMPSYSEYNGELYAESHTFCTWVLEGLTEKTGCENRGIYETTGMTLINWTEIPCCVVSVGFLSNKEEELNLVSSEYQRKVIEGLADGIDKYFN
ncbi:MAG: N-acetylmuramoyl-L-alanine amidase [Lachnospiraceae bacterium]|nr:N-acetylmuramoyl-L-alanine amidase [Lachnospiraceae bacterium]